MQSFSQPARQLLVKCALHTSCVLETFQGEEAESSPSLYVQLLVIKQSSVKTGLNPHDGLFYFLNFSKS